MYLTLSKRFEFSASHRYHNPDWSPEKNAAVFGPAAGTEHGYGQNYVAYFVFHGDINPETGMVINVTDIKERINSFLNVRYDHKFLNLDTTPFDSMQPTPENIAARLLEEAIPLFSDEQARPVVCHLSESPSRAATAYADGRLESHYCMEFSAARRTFSPLLSEQENRRLFGIAAEPGGHGHGYQLRISLEGPVNSDTGMIVNDIEAEAVLHDLRELLDHKNLSTDITDLKGHPVTTENLSRYIWTKLAGSLPLKRVRLHERSDFFAEYHGSGQFFMGVKAGFNAAHRLHSPLLSEAENRQIYEKCNNPNGHGHLYCLEATIGGEMDERSGALYPLDKLVQGVDTAITPWKFKHLNFDTDDFTEKPSTSENMINILWPRIDNAVGDSLHRLRLWETPNNRFTLRREVNP